MTQAQRNDIASPAAGLMVWCTDCGTAGEFQGYNGTTWTNLTGGIASVPVGRLAGLTCSTATNNGTLVNGIVASGVNSVIAYTGGNAGTHSGQSVNSTGVTGLTAALSAGNFTSSTGTLTYTITGTPASAGTASFAINIGGQTCSLTRTVSCGSPVTFTYNGASVTYGTATGANSKCWLDRNLGATQVATSSTDAASYGHLFQWGRGADGHQIRTSAQTTGQSTSTTPGSSFLIGAANWYSGTNPDLLWQGVSGTNNPCPSGYRLPTDVEWEAERTSWGANNNATGAINSPLKLPMSGYRWWNNGTLLDVGTGGRYWSSTNTVALVFASSSSNASGGFFQSDAFAVRCLKD
jgi:hypothetical protein